MGEAAASLLVRSRCCSINHVILLILGHGNHQLRSRVTFYYQLCAPLISCWADRHGCETPGSRQSIGKPPAQHQLGATPAGDDGPPSHRHPSHPPGTACEPLVVIFIPFWLCTGQRVPRPVQGGSHCRGWRGFYGTCSWWRGRVEIPATPWALSNPPALTTESVCLSSSPQP